MNNSLRALFAFATIGLSTVCASEFAPLHVSVPFAFNAGKTTLPAGEYTVVEQNSNVILIRGTHGNAILVGTASGDVQSRTGMSFQHTDKGYFLKEVHALGKAASVVPVIESTEK